MKFTAFLISICLSLVGISQQQVTNGGFEEINPNVQFPEYPFPENWTSYHSTIDWNQYPCIPVPVTGEVTADSYSGDWAIKMQTKGCEGESVLSGGYFLGALNPELPIFYSNIYTSRPESLSFYYKFNSVENDSARYYLSLMNYDTVTPGLTVLERIDTVGFVSGFLSENIDSYTQVVAPIEYLSEDFPLYISIGFLSGVGCLSNINCSEGTTLWVDQVELLGESLNVQGQDLSERSISLYPNPANNSFRISWKNDAEPRKLILFDYLGREIKRWSEIEESYSLEGLDSGTYMIGIETSETTYFKRLVKN
ncbi:MAG: T9SS type A sorting domain-containing protein [Flavobacteriales bacterium]|nr:T9SS type A sorting domain-containing protein [Flavobacteriales bacterium]